MFVTEAKHGAEGELESLESLAGFRVFYQEALPLIYGYLYRRCGARTAAEDLTQETFLAAVARIKAGKGSDVSLPWLIGVARHKLIGWFRAQEREGRKVERMRRTAPAFSTDGTGVRTSGDPAWTALDELPPAQRAALVLRYLDDLPVADVARTLGRSLHATESVLARGRAALRERCEGVADDG